jgi:hypothetical protein
VDVVGHQHVGMQDATRGKRALAQKVQVAAAVAVVEEAGQSIVAALDNVLRYAWDIESWMACHTTSLAARTDRKSRCSVIHPVRLGPAQPEFVPGVCVVSIGVAQSL